MTQFPFTLDFIREGPLNVGYSVMAFVANEGQNKGQRSVHEQGKAELHIFYLSETYLKAFWHLRRPGGTFLKPPGLYNHISFENHRDYN